MNTARNVVALAVPDQDLVRVSPGQYAATYVRHVGTTGKWGPKVRVEFQLLAHPELILPRWYPVKDHRLGRIVAGRHTDIVRELSATLGRRLRHDRIAVSCLEGLVVRVEVRDVVEDRRQRELADVNRYSVVSRLLGRDL